MDKQTHHPKENNQLNKQKQALLNNNKTNKQNKTNTTNKWKMQKPSKKGKLNNNIRLKTKTANTM